MKRSRSTYEAESPHSRDNHLQSAFDQNKTPSPQASYPEFAESFLDVADGFDLLQQFTGPYGEFCHVQEANTSNQSDVASGSLDAQRIHLHTQQRPPQYSDSALRGTANHAERAGPIRASHETRDAQQRFLDSAVASPYKTKRRSVSIVRQQSATPAMPNSPAFLVEASGACISPYSSYRGLFSNSDGARNHRHMSTRFGRRPYIDPEDDSTIEEVEVGRDYHVGRIYDAMVRSDRAQDNAGSIAMKRWVLGAHYKSDLVEAFAHKVFDCLLVQVKEGFRGWHHNDYVDDDRKGEKEDREADCMGRLDNIIDALEREKTICEDVVNSASQIRMFVNAPTAYAARKYQNRLGNSKRGRTKDVAELNPRPTKIRRTGRRQTRDRSTPVPDLPLSRDTTPQFQTPATSATPYYTTPCSPQFHLNSTSGHPSPRQPLHRPTQSRLNTSTLHRQSTATSSPPSIRPDQPLSGRSRPIMSPPTHPASRVSNTHHMPMPQAQMLPKPPSPMPPISPLTRPTYHSAPPSPNDAKYTLTSITATSPETLSPLNTVHTFDAFSPDFSTPLDPSLISSDSPFTSQAWADTHTSIAPAASLNYFDPNPAAHISLADIEHTPLHPFEALDNDPVTDFETYWNQQEGVQDFSFG